MTISETHIARALKVLTDAGIQPPAKQEAETVALVTSLLLLIQHRDEIFRDDGNYSMRADTGYIEL